MRRFERSKDSFSISHIIGEGQYGTVFLGTARGIYGPGETKVAVKQVCNSKCGKNESHVSQEEFVDV